MPEHKTLEPNEKKLVAFALFGAAMRMDKSMSVPIVLIVEKLGIEKEFEDYATSWIEHCESNKT